MICFCHCLEITTNMCIALILLCPQRFTTDLYHWLYSASCFSKGDRDPKWRESCDIIPCRQLNQLNSIEKQTVSCWDSKFPFNRGKSFLLSKAKGGIDRTDSPMIIWHHLEERNQFGTGPEMCLSHSPRNMPKPAAATFKKVPDLNSWIWCISNGHK